LATSSIIFTVPSNVAFDSAYEYDIAYFKNPQSSRAVSGFRVVINDNFGNNIYDSTSLQIVSITPGDIVNASLDISSQKVLDNCTYTFKFSITNNVPAGGNI
jgi:hypothetical protein